MKLTRFLALVGVIACAGVLLLLKACKSDQQAPQKQVASAPVAPPDAPPAAPAPAPTPAPTAATASDGELAARPYDAEVLGWATQSISGDKRKDVSKGKPYKVNVYQDAGHTTVNRAKVDLDRDDKFDEKYTFEQGKITLQRAPADDEKYTETYHWTGTAWAKQ